MEYRSLIDMVELQLLKKIAIQRRDEINELRARIRMAEEIIAEVGMMTEEDNIIDLAAFALDILANGYEDDEGIFNATTKPLGFEEEDLFKYRS